MLFSPTRWLNIAAIAGIGAMMAATGLQTSTTTGTDDVDMVVTGSVTETKGISHALLTAIDHGTDRTCQLALHQARGYDVHLVEPGRECAVLSDLLAKARAWRQDRQDTITVTDARGQVLMRLAHGDGVAFEVIYPTGLEVSLSAD